MSRFRLRRQRSTCCLGVLAALVIGALGAALAAEQVRVEVQLLVIRSGKGSMHAKVAEAKKDDMLDVVQRDADDWLKVRFGDKEGYIKATALKPRGATGLSALAEGAAQLSGQTSDVGASAAARGIDDNAIAYASSKGMNTDGLKRMLDSRDRVVGQRWLAFTREGRVGPARQ